MSADWQRFNDQFRETVWETRERQKARRNQRRAEGKCWQCAQLIAVCTCPNIKHDAARGELWRAGQNTEGD